MQDKVYIQESHQDSSVPEFNAINRAINKQINQSVSHYCANTTIVPNKIN